MALIQNINGYINAVNGLYGGFESKGAVNRDSEQRNFIGAEMQWMKDNKIELTDPEAQKNFDNMMAVMTGLTDGDENFKFGNVFFASSQLGDAEVTAMAKAMQQLNEMQAAGKITMDEYAGHMTELFSTEMIDNLEAGGSGKFTTFVQNVYNLDEDREPDPDVKSDNAERVPVDRRPVINTMGDYKTSVMERRGEDAPTYSTVDEAKNALYDTIRDAQKADPPQITQEQFDAVHAYITSGMAAQSNPDGTQGMNYTDVVVYAVQDALASGNQDVIDKFMNPDTLKGLQNGKLDGLSDLDLAARGGSVSYGSFDDVGDAISGVADGFTDIANGALGGATVLKLKGMGLLEKDESTGTYPGVDMLADTMVCNYFDPMPDADGNKPEGPGITADEYFRMLDTFESMTGGERTAYLEHEPAFAAANAAMNQIDQITGAMTEALDAGKQPAEVAQALNEAVSGGPRIDGVDVLKAGMQVANGQARDLSEVMPDINSDVLDHDAEMTAEDIALLQQKDPMLRYKDLQEAAVTVWRGGVYGSGDTRKERLAEAGFSPDEIDRIQDMVNHGPAFCQQMTPEKYDELYAEQDGGTLAERSQEFSARQLEAADKMLTYEGGGDFMAAHNGQEGVEDITREQADELYANAADAARRLIDDEADGPGLQQEGAADNLASYIAAGGEAAFEDDPRNAGRGEEYQRHEGEQHQDEGGDFSYGG